MIFIEQSCCIFLSEGTEECEALLVVDLLRRAKVEVTVASASGSREIVSSHKVHITADALAEEVDYSDVDMVVLPGGIPGTPNLAANKTVTDTCVSFAKNGKKKRRIVQHDTAFYGLEGSRTLDLSDANRTLIPTELRALNCPLTTRARGHRSF